MRTLIIATLLLLQQGMIPVVDTKGIPAVPLNPCLISGWPMNEGSGRTLNDVSGNANNALTGTTSPIWGSNAGFPGSSLTFSPTGANNAGATSTTLTNFDGSSAFSLAAWVNITSTAADEIILSDLNGSLVGWEITTETLSTNTLEFLLINNNSSNRIYVHGSTAIASTGKHYVVATYDGSKTAAGVKLYVDGSADTVTTVQNTLTGSTASGRAAGLGTRPGDGNGMHGVEAAAAIYNCVLTPTQIATYNARGPQIN